MEFCALSLDVISQEKHRWCRDKISKLLNKIVFRKKKKKMFSETTYGWKQEYKNTRITAYFFVNLVDCFSMGTTSPNPSPTPTNAN